MILHIFIFLACCVLLYFSGDWVVGGLMRTARFLGWKEFVVAFFVMAFAASLPNFFVGITSALKGIPELSFGDIAGNNLVALTLAVGLAALFAKKGIPAESRAIQTTSVFTLAAAILPLILIWDGELSRPDGGILILFFLFYLFWLFSKKERFSKIYDEREILIGKDFKNFFRDIIKVFFGIFFLIIAAQGIVASAQFFARTFNFPLVMVGVLITGLGSALPEIYFAVISARKEEDWMILGNLMGAVIVPATLVLGIITLICPIKIVDFSPFVIARIFLIISTLFFFFFIKTDRHLTKKEAFVLMGIYIIFILVEILTK
ncbi:MAG TPA: sodium:calcium antiporter [Patescibacteria group bacterium]|nr:sodium:calcium antiporter [Patescibacteria group bacterium]